MTALIPRTEKQLGGPFVETTDGFAVLAHRDKALIVEFHDKPKDVDWLKEFAFYYCREQHDAETFKLIREATADELKQYRVPIWIQDDETPDCCGRPMQFVGQIDDNRLCAERPAGAKKWWHDEASFYVFTCPVCLECKAIGQQF